MRAFIINLDSAADRWAISEKLFAGTSLPFTRVPAVEGDALQLPHVDYSEPLYRWFHGRSTNPREIGCYLSHLRAMEQFLATTDEHALIVEDDIGFRPEFEAVLTAAMTYASSWNILRLSGLGEGQPAVLAALPGNYSLCVSLDRLKGTGAYVLDRAAATGLLRGLRPMRLPYDHALDREWFQGLRAAYIQPFPISQTESPFASSIQKGRHVKLSRGRRYVTTYPYQAANELSRWLFRSGQWLRFKTRHASRPPRIPAAK